MKIAIFVEDITPQQLEYLRSLAQDNNIQANFVVESTTTVISSTEITGEMIQAVATQLGKTVLEVATLASEYGISTVQEALAHEDVPTEIKEILEGYL